MAKPVKPAKKKKSGNLLVHVVILLLLATVGWRLYALQGQVRAAQAERDQYVRQVENVQQEMRRCGATSQKVPLEEKNERIGPGRTGHDRQQQLSVFRSIQLSITGTAGYYYFNKNKNRSNTALMEYEVGTVLEGKVTSITKFGAFVALEGGKSGLVHISEIANSYVNDVHDFLQEGQDVKVKLLAIKDGKLDLSIKRRCPHRSAPAQRSFQPRPAAVPVPARRRLPGGPPFRQRTPPPPAIWPLRTSSSSFSSSSERKMADLNRNISGKQGGRRRKINPFSD